MLILSPYTNQGGAIMNKKWTTAAVMIGLAVFILLALNTHTLAGRGCGYQPKVGWHQGSGYHHNWNEMPCDYAHYGRGNNAEVEKEIKTFLSHTKELREKLFNKKQQLTTELEKENPDVGVAKNIQSELSELRTEFDQKWIEHTIQMKKLDPNFGRGKGYCRY